MGHLLLVSHVSQSWRKGICEAPGLPGDKKQEAMEQKKPVPAEGNQAHMCLGQCYLPKAPEKPHTPREDKDLSWHQF